MSQNQPFRLFLTPEQREVLYGQLGRYVEAIDLEPDPTPEAPAAKAAVPKFQWRLSIATGIPRQGWLRDDPADGTTGTPGTPGTPDASSPNTAK